MKSPNVLTLPGWQVTGFAHWQKHWEVLHGYVRVEQHDWLRPLRGDWLARLEEALLQQVQDQNTPCVLVAHNLGCLLVAAWAARSRNTHLVRAALLVEPLDVEQDRVHPLLSSWVPMVQQPLPFKSTVLTGLEESCCTLSRAKEFARTWGADFIVHRDILGSGDWAAGHEILMQLIQEEDEKPWQPKDPRA